MIRYVPDDLRQASVQLRRRADELRRWLDDTFAGAVPGTDSAEVGRWNGPGSPAEAAASLHAAADLACYRAVSAAEIRLRAAAVALAACARDLVDVDRVGARQLGGSSS